LDREARAKVAELDRERKAKTEIEKTKARLAKESAMQTKQIEADAAIEKEKLRIAAEEKERAAELELERRMLE